MMSRNRPVFHLLIESLKRLIGNSTINQMFTSEAVGSKSHAYLNFKEVFAHMWSLWKNVAGAVEVALLLHNKWDFGAVGVASVVSLIKRLIECWEHIAVVLGCTTCTIV